MTDVDVSTVGDGIEILLTSMVTEVPGCRCGRIGHYYKKLFDNEYIDWILLSMLSSSLPFCGFLLSYMLVMT